MKSIITTAKVIAFSSILAATSIFLSACGSGDGIGGTGITPIVEGTLESSDETKLTAYFQNYVRSNRQEVKDDSAPTGLQGGAPVINGVPSSKTNIQEAGVDEADLIKTDGRYIYGVSKPSPQAINSGVSKQSIVAPSGSAVSDIIRIMDTQGTDGIKEIKQITSDDKTPWNIAGLYLHKARLVALTSAKQNYYTNWFNSSYFASQKTKVVFIDVNDPKNSNIDATLNFDGQLIDSRRNGDILYMVLRHFPDYQYIDEPKLSSTTSKDFLPSYYLDNQQKQLIAKPKNCYVQADQKGSMDIITLVSVDLSKATPQINSQCYVGSAEAIYASQNAFYLATTRWSYQADKGVAAYDSKITTDIHKFNYDGLNFDYRGSGEIDGHLGFKQDSKSFRFSEHNGLLRVVTFDEDQWITIMPLEGDVQITSDASSEPKATKSPVLLTILKEDPAKKALQLISKLPNKNRPDPIGLPREQLYATRFIGDRAYVVTFRVTDPLYVLDLSNPTDPFIAGELKVDGYSDFLQPVSENLLLGLGKDAIPDGSGGDGRGAWYQGVKLSLIDVSDPANPREADKVILGKRGTDSAALYNHHALTGLKVADKYRVAIPVNLHQEDAPNYNGQDPVRYYHPYKQTGLHRFEIDINSQTIGQIPVLEVANSDIEPVNTPPIYNDRSVIIGENVYYMHDGKFWSQDWSGSNQAVGPK